MDADSPVRPLGGTAAADWELWSTTARLVVTDPDALDDALAVAHAMLAEVDLAASRFRPDSEVSALARRTDAGPVEVSPVLADLLAEALDVAARTDGAVDPTVGATLRDLGYDADIAEVRRRTAVSLEEVGGRTVARVRRSVGRVPGWRTVRLTGRSLEVPPGTLVDLGATAKAVAADRVATQVAADLGTGVLVSLGGDIATAGPAPAGDWQVRVQDTPADPVAHISLPGGSAVATSSTQRRTWNHQGRTVSHVVDPATSRPADVVWRSVTVAAATCRDANAVATAVLAKGHDGLDWLVRQQLPARLVDLDGRVRTLAGWPAEPAAA